MRIRSCILLALSLGWTHRISAESLYSVTDLGTLGGCCTEAHGINNVGQVRGSSSTLDGLLTHAFLYRNGQMMDLNDSFGRALVVGNSVSNPGHVVGVDRFLLINPFAFSYYSGQVISLGALGGGRGAHSAANSVNDSGQVTGFTSTGGASTLAA
jgi:probable HAF family extracellular repeat protein